MIGFELQISGVGSDRSTNCATTTAHLAVICSTMSLVTNIFYFFGFLESPAGGLRKL